jgi:ketosteroid isomerase-like protein
MTLRVEDRLALLDLAARVNEAASRRDVEAYLNYFTTDGALEGDMGSLTGQDALRGGLAPIWEREGRATLHLALNLILDGEGDHAKLSYRLLIVRASTPQAIVGTAQVYEQLQKVEGRWLVARHRVVLLVHPRDQ